jgi:hypothetical protein
MYDTRSLYLECVRARESQLLPRIQLSMVTGNIQPLRNAISDRYILSFLFWRYIDDALGNLRGSGKLTINSIASTQVDLEFEGTSHHGGGVLESWDAPTIFR